MGDDGAAAGKRGKGLSIFLGIVGAVLGFVGALALAPYNRMDPIASGMIALFVFGPIGAAFGAWLGASLGGWRRGAEAAAGATATSTKAAADTPPAPIPSSEAIDTGTLARKFGNGLFLAIVGAAALGAVIYVYQKSDETPPLNPKGPNPMLQFEIRLPAGAPMPAEKDLRVSLHSPPHDQVWATMKEDLFRRDGERPVLVGEAELKYRTAARHIQTQIAGQHGPAFYLTLLDKAPHTAELGEWQARDGSEIRYRAKWPGRE